MSRSFVGHDGHAAPADFQPEHERGYSVAGFMVGRAFVSASPAVHCTPLRHGKSSMAFGPYRKTNPQNCEDHICDPGRQQMKGCCNHHN